LSGSFCFFPELGLFDISLCGSYLIGWAAAAEAKKSQAALILPEARDFGHETSHWTGVRNKTPAISGRFADDQN